MKGVKLMSLREFDSLGRSVGRYWVPSLLMGTSKNSIRYQALRDYDVRQGNKRETHLTCLGSKKETGSWFHIRDLA